LVRRVTPPLEEGTTPMAWWGGSLLVAVVWVESKEVVELLVCMYLVVDVSFGL
jgi:hypothetical protein